MGERPYSLAALAREIRARPSSTPTRLVAIDGCGGAGKSTLARALAAVCGGVPVVRVDDFLSWHDLDRWWDRLEREALRPVLTGGGARYRARDWAQDPLGEGLNGWVQIPPAELVIVEGISCSRCAITDKLTMALWVHAPRFERLRRGVARDGEQRRSLWTEWMRAEDVFFADDGAPRRADYLVSGLPTIPHDPECEVSYWTRYRGLLRRWRARSGRLGRCIVALASVSIEVQLRGVPIPLDVITIAVRWYLRYGLSYRDVEELLAERGITVDHVTIYRWVQRFTPLLIDAARLCRHVRGDRWFVDETYVKVAGRWVYLYRAIDQYGQVIDVLVSEKRDLAATRWFFTRALEHGTRPSEVTTDGAAAYPRVLEELIPAACHITEQYTNNPVEADHGRLKARLRPMRGLKQLRSARVISTGHAFVQNLRRGHYELGVDADPSHRLPAAFVELALAI